MIDPNMLGDLARDHQQQQLDREEAKAFLGDLMAVCNKHNVFLRTSDQKLIFLKAFENSNSRTVITALVDKQGKCGLAKVELK
jgi:hypothetical protein